MSSGWATMRKSKPAPVSTPPPAPTQSIEHPATVTPATPATPAASTTSTKSDVQPQRGRSRSIGENDSVHTKARIQSGIYKI
jgi:hypothetical protein